LKKLPDEILKAWQNKKGPVVFSTVNKEYMPNSIYATCVSLYDENTVLIADNFFSKTRHNIFQDSRASILFITEDNKSYQLKGQIQYHVKGRYYDDMKKWNPEQLPGYAVAIVKIKESYCGAKKLS
jgi:predicted pyridoxine 5'-phosphate oxidase superfamily flavin-nucleotide-binding protein